MLHQIAFLSIVSAIGVISATLCAPALPFIADHFSAHFSHIQFTISLFLVGNAFGQFISGPLSDQIGQRKVLLGGLLLYILASCGCALAEHMSALLVARFFQGMSTSVGPVLARAIVVRHFPLEKSAEIQSYNAIGIGVFSMAAIICSGYLTHVSWRSNFWLAAGLGVFLFVWTRAVLPRSLAASSISLKQFILPMKQIFTTPRFLGASACHSMTYGLMYGYIALFPFLLIEIFHEKNPTQVGIYSAYMIAFYMLGAFLASRAVLKKSSQLLIRIGVCIQLASGVLLIANPSTPIFFTALSLFNISIGVILPLTSALALAPFAEHAAGAASSSLGMTYRLIGSLLSMAICQLPMTGGVCLGAAMCLLSVASLGVLKWVVERPVVKI